MINLSINKLKSNYKKHMEDLFYCIFYNCISTHTPSGVEWRDKKTNEFRFDLNKNNHLYLSITVEFLYSHEYGLSNEETKNFILDLILKYETDDALYCIENDISLYDFGDMANRLTARNAPIPALPPEVLLIDAYSSYNRDDEEVCVAEEYDVPIEEIDVDEIGALENTVEDTHRILDAIIDRMKNRLQ